MARTGSHGNLLTQMCAVSILDKEELVATIEELLDEEWEEILTAATTPWDLANAIAVLVLK